MIIEIDIAGRTHGEYIKEKFPNGLRHGCRDIDRVHFPKSDKVYCINCGFVPAYCQETSAEVEVHFYQDPRVAPLFFPKGGDPNDPT